MRVGHCRSVFLGCQAVSWLSCLTVTVLFADRQVRGIDFLRALFEISSLRITDSRLLV